jgi:hypothetical protein
MGQLEDPRKLSGSGTNIMARGIDGMDVILSSNFNHLSLILGS